MSEHRNALQPGFRLHWYVIGRVLGQGGFGITYLADDSNLNQPVAIKEYLPVELAVREGNASIHPLSGEHGEQFRWGLERFIVEAQTLARFKHPNIVRVFTVFTENNSAYMVMEYEQGRGLHDILKDRKTLPEGELRNILLPILDGLARVHESGFVHRDIKPANVYVRSDGSPVLLDFGSARQSLGAVTRTLTAMVSPGFAPFEQYTGKGERQGPWTDIYGLGATLYRAAIGRAPADAMDRSEALLRAARDIYVPALEIRPSGYSENFLAAIDRAMAFKADDRPRSIAEWRAAFDEGRSASAGPPTSELATVAVTPDEATPPGGDTVKILIHVPEPVAPELEQAAVSQGKSGWRWLAAAGIAVFVLLLVVSGSKERRQRALQLQTTVPGMEQTAADAAASGEAKAQSVAGAAQPIPVGPPQATGDESGSGPPENEVAAEPAALPEEIGGFEAARAFDPSTARPVTEVPRETGGMEAPRRRVSMPPRERERLALLQRRVQQNPGNVEARQRLMAVVDEYEMKVKQAVRDKDFDLAEAYINEMLRFAPGNERLKEALVLIDRERNVQKTK